MKRKALRLYRFINRPKNRRVYLESICRTLVEEYNNKNMKNWPFLLECKGESDHPREALSEQAKTLVDVIEKQFEKEPLLKTLCGYENDNQYVKYWNFGFTREEFHKALKRRRGRN